MVVEHELHLVYPAKVCVIIGEGNCNPLQYSCLENPMDRWVWQATVHEITKSWTWLDHFTCIIRALPKTYRSAAMCVCVLSSFSWVWLFATPWDCSLPGTSVHGIFQATAVGCHALFQGILVIQESNSCLLQCRWILSHWATRQALSAAVPAHQFSVFQNAKQKRSFKERPPSP